MRGATAAGRVASLLVLLLVAVHGAPAAAQSCVGDCPPLNLQVAVNELIIGVNIALGGAGLESCPSYDVNGDQTVGVAELVSAVNNALRGCAGGPTPSSTGTAPPPPPTDGATASITPTATWTPAPGPAITFFGVTHPDDSLQAPDGQTPDGIPIYQRLFGHSFKLVVEADGIFGAPSTYEVGAAPALQIQSTNPLGNGSAAVCDVEAPNFGGVPAINPPQFENPGAIADALNDFGCRFIDGEGNRRGRSCSEGCVRFFDGEYHCVAEGSDRQFCGVIDVPLTFPDGDTLVSVRVRDVMGRLGPVAQLILRVSQ